ncbi:type I restriction-modification system subunit M [Actinacidiphila glaucinigra]|uniref:class I SAM-dependent DNA methyltransferase n=1 Tax=Actinacidiphila glaucinigra TaxID=235986 RepID=UPI0036C99347
MPPKDEVTEQEAFASASSRKELHGILWQAADKLRGSVDVAQYKEFVLGLIFLKYVSDAFDARRSELAEDGVSEDHVSAPLKNHSEHAGAGVFVPPIARWSWITAHAKNEGVGRVLDDAMDAVMRENPSLTGVLPKIFNRPNVDQKRLAALVDVISDARFADTKDAPAQDVLGEVYEYFLGNFARAEGRRGGEFYTPRSVVRLIVEILEPYKGRVYDPACGTGGMLVEASKFIEARQGREHKADIAVYGQELNERFWRLAKMNLAIHGIDGNLADHWGDTFANDKHPGLEADFVMASPPFNIANWARNEGDSRWAYGVPPGKNANYAWLQHAISKLGDKGTAAVVLPNGSMFHSGGEARIRQAIVDADLVASIITLPPQLFYTTSIPACVWVLTKDKPVHRRGQILFIDARDMGETVGRTERLLTDTNLTKIASVYRAWRGTPSARAADLPYSDEPGFCLSAALETVREHVYVLTPERFVSSAPQVDTRLSMEQIGPAALMRDLYAIFD